MAKLTKLDNWKTIVRLKNDLLELQKEAEDSAEQTQFMGDVAEHVYFKGLIRAYKLVIDKLNKLIGV